MHNLEEVRNHQYFVLVDGVQMTHFPMSYAKAISMVEVCEEKGIQDVQVVEAPQ